MLSAKKLKRAEKVMSESTSVNGVVGVVCRGEHVLVIRRAEGVAAPGRYCFPGGGRAPHETEQEALIREFREELGILVLPKRRLWESVTPWGVRLAWWSAEIVGSPTLRPNPAEVAAVAWLTWGELAELNGLLASNRQFLAALRSGSITLVD